MTEDKSCKYCGCKFPAELLNTTNIGESLLCENCGTEVIKERDDNTEGDSRIDDNNQTNGFSRRVYENLRNKKSPVEKVFKDSDFPVRFKDNFKIVASRLVYPHIQSLKCDSTQNKEGLELNQEILDDLYEKINPIMNQRVKDKFLINLYSMRVKEFDKWLKLLQKKIEVNKRFCQDFVIYLRWLIREVFIIIIELWDEPELPRFERGICDDLKSFELNFNNSTSGNQENSISIDNSITLQKGLFDDFQYYLHEVEPTKQYIEEFNASGNWMKNFRPTKTFINFLDEKRKRLTKLSKNDRTNTLKNQIEVILDFSSLVTKIRENNILNKVIKAKILENPGKYNAYDIHEWLLLSDNSTRNQLKRILTKDEYQQYVRTQTHVSLDTIREIAVKKGGKCHTKSLKNAKSKVHLECAEGHHFNTSYDSVVYQNTWCPDCNIYVSETICRKFFEKIFKRPFPKSYPEWLINENGNQMELDGYNKDLSLAFEYQGIQHRKKAFGMTEDGLKNRQKEDALKLKLCEENGVTLLQIPDDEIVPYDNMQEYIEHEYERKTAKVLKDIPRYDYKEFVIHENEYAKKFREYVEKKGGTLVTPYFSQRKEVTLICEKGHQWTTTPNSVYKDNWCSECAGNIKGTTEYFREIGKEFNCELISEYVNAKTPLTYKCPKTHEFTIKSPYWLKRTYKEIEILCPKCKMDVFAEKFQHLVKKKEGQLLTPYKGRFRPITIKCNKNHTWNTTPGAVYQGSWCKTCAEENHPNRERLLTAKKEFVQMIESLKYSLLSEYQNNTKIVQIKCQRQHQFTMTPKYFKRLVNQEIEPCSKCRKGN